MSGFANKPSAWGRTGSTARLIIGAIIVLFVGYIGVVFIAPTGLDVFWPYAPLWAAVGWGASRLSFRPAGALALLGLIMDLVTDAPVGCWSSILLVAFLTASIFRQQALTDKTGVIRFFGDVSGFVLSFMFSRWLMGSYLGGVETREIIGGFLSAALLYYPLRPLFRLTTDERVD